MKSAVFVALAAVVLATPAMAQSAGSPNCTGFDPAPTLPDGTTASHDAMTAAGARVDAWRQARDQKLALCQADVVALRAQLDAMVQAHNTAGQERMAVVNAWNAEVDEYGARGRRQRGAELTRPRRQN